MFFPYAQSLSFPTLIPLSPELHDQGAAWHHRFQQALVLSLDLSHHPGCPSVLSYDPPPPRRPLWSCTCRLGTLAAMGRRCDSCIGPLSYVSVSVAAGPGSIVLLRLGYLPFDIDGLVRHFAPLLVPSLVLCGDMTFVPWSIL